MKIIFIIALNFLKKNKNEKANKMKKILCPTYYFSKNFYFLDIEDIYYRLIKEYFIFGLDVFFSNNLMRNISVFLCFIYLFIALRTI